MEKDLLPRTLFYARKIIAFYASLPNSTVAQILGKQLLRSGTSVGANYREANQGRSRAELLESKGLGDKVACAYLIVETRELIAIFTTIIKNTKQNAP